VQWPMIRLDAMQVPTFGSRCTGVAISRINKCRSFPVAADVPGRVWHGCVSFRPAGAGRICGEPDD
jgi:hypothetical protein